MDPKPEVKKEQDAQGKKPGLNKPFTPKAPKVEGKVTELKGYIYDCMDPRQQSDQFVKTTKEIAEYVGTTYNYGGDARELIENLKITIFEVPADPSEDATKSEIRIWEKTLDEHVKRMTGLQKNIKAIYSLVRGQCTDVMRQKLEAQKTFNSISRSLDGLGLLKALKSVSYQFQSQKYLPHSIHHEGMKRCYLCYQGKVATTQAYMETFQNTIDVITHTGGEISGQPGIKTMILEEHGLSTEDLQRDSALLESVTKETTARFGKMIEDMENDFLQGRNNYPLTVLAAYNLLTNWNQDSRYNAWRPQNADYSLCKRGRETWQKGTHHMLYMWRKRSQRNRMQW